MRERERMRERQRERERERAVSTNRLVDNTHTYVYTETNRRTHKSHCVHYFNFTIIDL